MSIGFLLGSVFEVVGLVGILALVLVASGVICGVFNSLLDMIW